MSTGICGRRQIHEDRVDRPGVLWCPVPGQPRRDGELSRGRICIATLLCQVSVARAGSFVLCVVRGLS